MRPLTFNCRDQRASLRAIANRWGPLSEPAISSSSGSIRTRAMFFFSITTSQLTGRFRRVADRISPSSGRNHRAGGRTTAGGGWIIFLAALALLLVGCGDSEATKLRAEVAELRSELETIRGTLIQKLDADTTAAEKLGGILGTNALQTELELINLKLAVADIRSNLLTTQRHVLSNTVDLRTVAGAVGKR